MKELNVRNILIPANRQRKDLGDLTELKKSILNLGLLNPLIVERKDDKILLVAGERRLTSICELIREGLWDESKEVPITLVTQLSEKKRTLIELDENIKRQDLSWQDYASAVSKMYQLESPTTQKEFGEKYGISQAHVHRILAVGEHLGNPLVQAAKDLSNAYTITQRVANRTQELQMKNAESFVTGLFNDGAVEVKSSLPVVDEVLDQMELEEVEYVNSRYTIHQTDFIEWAEGIIEDETKVNLLHLDFPYGIGHDSSDQGNADTYGTYADSPDVYKNLVLTLLRNQDKFVAESAHCICWLSLNFAEWTKEQFRLAGWKCQPQPFIWHKNDNRGIISSAREGMRNVGEYALIFSRGGRAVVKNISNIFPHPTTKKFHASEKPVGMLKYLLGAFCDSTSIVLDPTCGSGTAIQVAESLGADHAYGFELNEDWAKQAQAWLEEARSNPINELDFDLGEL